MERKTTKALLTFLLLLTALLGGTEGGREMPTKDDMESPELLGLIGLGPFRSWPFPNWGIPFGLPFGWNPFGHFWPFPYPFLGPLGPFPGGPGKGGIPDGRIGGGNPGGGIGGGNPGGGIGGGNPGGGTPGPGNNEAGAP